MRIIGGRLKGKVLAPPSGYKARPTTDFAREGLFNILDNEFELGNVSVLDLFGGTGAVSFEFASRGAKEVYCVEMAPENASFIRTQARRLGLAGVTVVRHNVFDFIPICRKQFDIVFADEEARTIRLSGRLNRYDDIRVLLRTYEEVAGVHFGIRGREIVVSLK